jgi:dienelactone hydrolase
MTLSTDISDFTRRDLTFRGKTKPVLVSGRVGPAVLVLHEVYGVTPTLMRLCRWIHGGGLRVYVPVMFGRPDASNPETISVRRQLALCVSREFTLFATRRPSPVTNWLRELAHVAHEECGGTGVGVIGLCLTGGFGLAMSVDPVVMAPVMGEPSLPAFRPAALEVSEADLAHICARTQSPEEFCVRGYRFVSDTLSPTARFEMLRRVLGNAFVYREFRDEDGNPGGSRAQGKPPHSVFTGDLVDEPGAPTRQAVDEVIHFFRERLSTGAKQAQAHN